VAFCGFLNEVTQRWDRTAKSSKRMYIRNPNAAAKVEKREPDIHTQTEKYLFKSRNFLSDLEMMLAGYTVQTAYE
jgi:hypothetical protein